MRQIGPCPRHHRHIVGFGQQSVVYAPEQTIGEERRAARLRSRSLGGVEHRPGPVALRLLTARYSCGQAAVFLDEERIVAVRRRHVLEDLGQSGEHPSASAGPEVLLPRGSLMGWIDVAGIAEVESRGAVEHDAVGVEQTSVHLVEIFLLSRQPVHLRHHRHGHIQGVGPPPVVGGGVVGHVAHHLTCAGYSLSGVAYII